MSRLALVMGSLLRSKGPLARRWISLLLLAVPGELAFGEIGNTTRPHPDSESRTLVSWVDGQPRVEVKVQVASLSEVLPGLEVADEELLDAARLEVARPAVTAYVENHLRVVVAGAAVLFEGGAVAFVEPGGARSPDGWQWVRVTSSGIGPVMAEGGPALLVEMDLFLETSPGHLDTLVVRWPDALPDVAVLSAGISTWSGSPGASLRWSQVVDGALGALLGVGWLSLALLLAAGAGTVRGRRSSLFVPWLVGAVMAGSAELAVPGLVGQWIEPRTAGLGAAIVAVYLGLDGVLDRGRTRLAWEGLAAGLVTGVAASLHPGLLPEALDPGLARTGFMGALVVTTGLGGLLLARIAAGLGRALPLVVAVAGLVVFAFRALGSLGPGA